MAEKCYRFSTSSLCNTIGIRDFAKIKEIIMFALLVRQYLNILLSLLYYYWGNIFIYWYYYFIPSIIFRHQM